MKKCILFIALAFLSLPLFSQILNSSFEEWESFPSFDKPMHWETNQDTFLARFVKDTISYDGDYALHAVPGGVSGWSDCSSRAEIGVKFNSPISSNQSLFFYIRALSVNAFDDTYANVGGQLFQGGNFISNYSWGTVEEFPDYTLIEIPFNLNNSMMIDSMTINITAAKGNAPNDGCFGGSQIWFDNFHIGQTTNIQSPSLSNITIFPNPANGEINLEGDISSVKKYRIINALGQVMESGSVDNSIMKINYVGVLFLVLENEEGERLVSKLINRN